jgi:predicted transcriptional regulator
VPDVKPMLFVRTWQHSSSVSEVAKKLGLTWSAVRQRANRYRSAGVKLKHFTQKVASFVDEANEMIENLERKKK